MAVEGGGDAGGIGNGQVEGGADGAGEPDLGDTMRDILTERGDKLGDGAPPLDVAPAEGRGTAPAGGDGSKGPGPDGNDKPAGDGASPPADKPPVEGQPGWQRPADLTKAPDSWKAEAKVGWETLPEHVRTEIYRREGDTAKGVAELKPFVESGRKFTEAIKPFVQELQQYGIDPYAHMQNLMNSHRTLALGTPEQKRALFVELSKAYKIPLPATAEPGAGEEGWVDPQLKAVQAELAELKSAHQTREQQEAANKRAQVAKEVDTFAKDPANPHFDEVLPDLTRLMTADRTLTLKEAYDKACWLVPSVRDKMVTQTAEAARVAAEAAERARATQAAASRGGPPKSTSKPATATGALGSMEDTMKETLAAINARSK